LLQAALRKVVGEHVTQQGSRVAPESLRFDFTAFSALTPEQIKTIENLVNEKIQMCLPISTEQMSVEKAKESGAMALFGEKYGAEVRVVSMENFSKEFCGGLHAKNTGEIGMFRILSESSVSAGVRRIEAATAFGALNIFREEAAIVSSLREQFKAKTENILERVSLLTEQLKASEKLASDLRAKIAESQSADLFKNPKQVKNIPLWVSQVSMESDEFSALLEGAQKTMPSQGIAVIANVQSNSGTIAVVVHAELVKKNINAGNIVKKLAELAGGKGGGRPNLAQAGTKNPEKIEEALKEAERMIGEMVL
jgi:alanyl-tRNA synthetase